MDYSASEIMYFNRCRRQWDYASPNRMALEPIVAMPHTAFYFGSLVHKGLETQIHLKARPEIDAVLQIEEDAIEAKYRETVGMGFSGIELDSVREVRAHAGQVLTNYFDYWGDVNTLGDGYEYMAAELTFKVAIPGTDHFLKSTADGVAVHERSGQLWVVEHKTFSMQPKVPDLMDSFQMQCYAWGIQQLFGISVAGAIYDGLYKKLPTVPEYLPKSDRLAKRKIKTTLATFVKAIQENNLNPKDYAEELAELSRQERNHESPFFPRHHIRFSQGQLQNFGADLTVMVNEMSRVGTPVYPNRRWDGCWDCVFREMCAAVSRGEDVTYFMEERYRKSVGHRTMRMDPIMSINDMFEGGLNGDTD